MTSSSKNVVILFNHGGLFRPKFPIAPAGVNEAIADRHFEMLLFDLLLPFLEGDVMHGQPRRGNACDAYAARSLTKIG